MKYDLIERCTKYSIETINFSKNIKRDIISTPIISQLIRSVTSVGANYSEANDSYSKKDMIHRVYIVRKELKESKYWFNVVESQINSEYIQQLDSLKKETDELIKIFSTIIKKIS